MNLLHFIETPLFTKQITELFTDDEYQQMQQELIKDPEKGVIISGTAGMRKIRFGRNNGKSGGVRILYYYADEYGRIYMIVAYPKSVKDNITPAEKNVFKSWIQQLKAELSRGQTTL